MNPTFTDLGNGTFTITQPTPPPPQPQPFDPATIQTQIAGLQGQVSTVQAQLAAKIALDTQTETANFQPQIDALNAQIAALQATLDLFNQQIPNPS